MKRPMDEETRATFWKAFQPSPIIMMRLQGSAEHPEPMTAQLDRNAHHAIWLFARRGNRIAGGGKAVGQVVTINHNVFASISGSLIEETDPTVRDRHWSNAVESWFPGGRDDPDVVMLRFDMEDAEVWTTHIGVQGAFSLLTGQPIDQDKAGEHMLGAV